MAYCILIWSGPQARLVDHESDGVGKGDDALLERLADAGRAARGLPPRPDEAQRGAGLACAPRHLGRAVKLFEDL